MPLRTVEFVHVFFEREDIGLEVQHRDNRPGIYDPDMLGVFGGHVDSDDLNPIAAARREVREETGLTGLPMRKLGTLSVVGPTPQGEKVKKKVTAFASPIAADFELPVLEGQGSVLLQFGQPLPTYPLRSDVLDLELARYYRDRFPA